METSDIKLEKSAANEDPGQIAAPEHITDETGVRSAESSVTEERYKIILPSRAEHLNTGNLRIFNLTADIINSQSQSLIVFGFLTHVRSSSDYFSKC